MESISFMDDQSTGCPIAILIPQMARDQIYSCYIKNYLGHVQNEIVAYKLFKNQKNTTVTEQKTYLAQELFPLLRQLDVKYLIVCDADYFKTLSGAKSAESSLGYVLDSKGSFKDEHGQVHSFEGFKIAYCPNFRSTLYDEAKGYRNIDLGMTAFRNYLDGEYVPPGTDIIHKAYYPKTVDKIREILDQLLEENRDLTSDIEAFSLKHYSAGIGTITFCVDQHNGVAFGVDLIDGPDGMPVLRPSEESAIIRQMLKDFFIEIRNRGLRILWHSASYDIYVLIYQLFMKDILDTEGLLEGIDVFLDPNCWEDTKHIVYLATNSCSGNNLGLKHNAHEFAGNYAVDEIKDITKIPFDHLLQYNLIDGLSTWFVYDKFFPIMVQDEQLEIYVKLFKPATIDIIQMQLTGMPLDMDMVKELNEELQQEADNLEDIVLSNPLLEQFLHHKRLRWIDKENARLKKKRRSMDDAKEKVSFNLNSPDDLKEILYDPQFMGLPVIDLTDSKEPSTGGETLEKLVNHTDKDDVIEFLNALTAYKSVYKLLTAFLPKFLEAYKGPDGWHYLFGNFNLGGTLSGRLSSSNPNLQNLPAKGKWAKKVKACFKAPPGWLFVGLDFDSLEDRISALQTKDPQKLKLYIDGYDGHCLRAYSYFKDQMPDIDPDSVQSINSIKKKYPVLRNESKTPTFSLTYGGTFISIINQMGWTEQKAKSIEASYHDLYKVSDDWVADRIQEATETGYVTCAFGLRVRTPILAKTVLKTRRTPYEAQSEARSAGNALGQSYCMLNSRASVEFMRKVRDSEFRLTIRPSAHIHDAQYFLIRDNIDDLLFVNEHLVKAVQWQEDPLIWHEQVKLGGEVSVFYPSWAEEMVIPNNVSSDEIPAIARKHLEEYGLI